MIKSFPLTETGQKKLFQQELLNEFITILGRSTIPFGEEFDKATIAIGQGLEAFFRNELLIPMRCSIRSALKQTAISKREQTIMLESFTKTLQIYLLRCAAS